MEHPSSELLVSLLEDRLEDPARATVAGHIDACQYCQAAIEGMAGDDLAEWRPAGRRPVETPTRGPAYERVVQ